MNKYTYVDRIIIEAQQPFVTPPEMTIDRAFQDEPFIPKEDLTLSCIYRVDKVIIEPFFLSDWSLRIETKYSDEFQKVAEIVGPEKAEEVLKALGK